jgi:hypothetical protein
VPPRQSKVAIAFGTFGALLLFAITVAIAWDCDASRRRRDVLREQSEKTRADEAKRFLERNPQPAVVPAGVHGGAATPPVAAPAGERACCKRCGSGSQPCGDSCISRGKTCHKGSGCAC